MDNSKAWLNAGGKYFYQNMPSSNKLLPPAVYELGYEGGMNPGFFLLKVSDSFELPTKIYDLETELLNRVKYYFENKDNSFGVIFKGLKGTGKTVTAKKISNDLNIPVILITKPFEDLAMGSFLNSIDQDIILFFDEFEKTFSFQGNYNEGVIGELLSLMDGVFTTDKKRLFLFTTNSKILPDSLIARPSRVRYIKDFSDISIENIKEIFEDLVVDKTLIPGLLTLVKTLKIITVDIIKSIADEANLFGRSDLDFYKLFNITRSDLRYELTLTHTDKRAVKSKVILKNALIHEFTPGTTVALNNGGYFADIVEVDQVAQTLKLSDVNWPHDKHDWIIVSYEEVNDVHRYFVYDDF